MKTYFECIECFARQAIDAARLLSADEEKSAFIISEIQRQSSEMDYYLTPPRQAQWIHKRIRELLQDDDPYRAIKVRSNDFAMKLYPELKKMITQSSDPFETALKAAIAGNIIDLGAKSYDEAMILDTVRESMDNELPADSVDTLREAVDAAEGILYLGDNAGEIVFDRLLIEQLPSEKITFVVRGGPVINDATLVDARDTGLTDIVDVMENGSNAPGTLLDDCSPEFSARFETADLVLSKGQGNYESLSDTSYDIVYLLMVKCPVIARDIGSEVGSMIVRTCLKDSMPS